VEWRPGASMSPSAQRSQLCQTPAARANTLGDVAAVVLERELALGGVDDRLDPLPDAAERAEARALVAAVGAESWASSEAMIASNS
jgi:hypothetical protein